jgi:hypothetical protein
MSSRFRLSYVALSATVALVSVACVDPKKTFGEFEDRVIDAAPIPDAPGGGGFFDINGPFLLSIAATSPVPVSPLRLLVNVALTETENGGTADITVQPLAVEACAKGMGGEPVGKTLTIEDVPINADGSFDFTAMDTEVVGEANPLICGTAIRSHIQLIGSAQSDDVFCGTVGGEVTFPIQGPLAGTFAAIRQAEPVMTGDANLPEAVTACPTGETPDAGPDVPDAGDEPDAGEPDAGIDASTFD